MTQNAPPQLCGIGDHSTRLAEALRAAGHRATVLARNGLAADDREIVPGAIGHPWLTATENLLCRLDADHVVLQYTPLMYSGGDWRVDRRLLRCWRSLAKTRRASLIVHEAYFRDWRHPPSVVSGTVEKALLKRFARASHDVFTASEPLCDEMTTWRLAREPILLPIGSNILPVPADVDVLRQRAGVAEDEVVLTLLGGGNGLKWSAAHVDGLEASLVEEGVPHCWLLLGGILPEWFRLTSRLINPGRLGMTQLSEHLQMTDIFVVPHILGLSAKRGTLMAALAHGLPVVGTRGGMTDSFWSTVPGVTLVDAADPDGLASAVVGLCADLQKRRRDGRLNAAYFAEHFAWHRIAARFLAAIARP